MLVANQYIVTIVTVNLVTIGWSMERAGFGRSDCDGEWQRAGLLRPSRVVDAQIVGAGSERPRVHDGLRFG